MNNHPTKPNSYCCPSIVKKSIPDIIHGRITECVHIDFLRCLNDTFKYLFSAQPSIRDLIENKYLHEWLHETTIRRCKEILNHNSLVSQIRCFYSHLLNILFIRKKSPT